jgi:hypothetical protein
MPHEPGHTNTENGHKNQSYTVYGTNEKYTGMVVEVGGYLYTTTDGTYQGTSVQLTTPPSFNRNQVMENQTPSTEQEVTDVVTAFIVGDGSDLGKTTFYYENGNVVPNGTRLHRHSVAPAGRSNFMTQHTMDGSERDVFLTRGMGTMTSNNRGGEILDVARRMTNTRQTQPTRTTQTRRRTTTTRRGSGNGGMSSGGGY